MDIRALFKTEKTRLETLKSDEKKSFDIIYDEIKNALLPFMLEKVDQGIVAIPLFLGMKNNENGVIERKLAPLIEKIIVNNQFDILTKRFREEHLEISYTSNSLDLIILVVNFINLSQ